MHRKDQLIAGKRLREHCPVFHYHCSLYHLAGGLKARIKDSHAISRQEMWAKWGTPFHWVGMQFRTKATEVGYQLDCARRSKGYTSIMLRLRIAIGVLCILERLWFYDFNIERVVQQMTHGSEIFRVAFMAVTLPVYLFQLIFTAHFLQFVLRYFTLSQVFFALIHISIVISFVAYIGTNSENLCQTTWSQVIDSPNTTRVEILDKLDERHWQSMMVTLASFEMLLIYRMPFIYQLYLSIVLYGSVLVVSGEVKYFRCADCVCRYSGDEAATVIVLLLAQMFVSRWFEHLTRLDYCNCATVFEESQRSDRLLHNVMPESIVEQLKTTTGSRRSVVRHFSLVSVLFADIVSFTTMSARLDADTLVGLLDRLFRHFDDICSTNNLEKIKTIGDCYMVAGGVPIENNHHFRDIALMGLQMVELLSKGHFRDPVTGEPIRVRVGCHVGPVTAGVIGAKKFAYDLWGDAVNTASRMESHGQPMKVHCSEDMAQLLKGKFVLEDRGEMYVKGKGNMKTHFILSEKKQKLKWKRMNS